MHDSMTTDSNSSCTPNFLFGTPKGLMKIFYATTTAWKIIDVLVWKDKHVSHGVGQYIIVSLTDARKEVAKDLPELYVTFIGKLYEILNHPMIVGQHGGSIGNGGLSSKV